MTAPSTEPLPQPAPDPDAPQHLVGYLDNEEWDRLIGAVNALVQQMEALPEGDVKLAVFRLLDGIDALHREALRRLVRLFKPGVLEQVITDPAIQTLMELYDLLPTPADATAPPPVAAPHHPVIPIRPHRAPPPAPPRFPRWVPLLQQGELLQPESSLTLEADGHRLLLARVQHRLFVLDGQCVLDGSSLAGAQLHGHTLSCPRHAGCHYDVRDGHRLGGGGALGCHPVQVDASGRVLVGLDMPFSPEMPSF